MVRRRLGALAPVLFVGLALALSTPASAQPKGKAKPAALKKPQKPAKPPSKKAEEEPKAEAKAAEPAPAEEKAPEPADKGEPSTVKAAGTNATKAQSTGGAVTVKETKEGVKTYKFGAIEVEGRSKSPEIIYFLRRVRAEFDASTLGHRSFMRELSDTRNRPLFR
jgi:hypothetical protein